MKTVLKVLVSVPAGSRSSDLRSVRPPQKRDPVTSLEPAPALHNHGPLIRSIKDKLSPLGGDVSLAWAMAEAGPSAPTAAPTRPSAKVLERSE